MGGEQDKTAIKIKHEEGAFAFLGCGDQPVPPESVRELSGAEAAQTLCGPLDDGVYNIECHYSLLFIHVYTPSCRLHTLQGF